ncbi:MULTISPECIES: LuxR C-terminal-related transcriptional regulator [unclassified Microbacterium]|uniref:helix-turn-helix transcriptional regulator n=1 Tax=unclassified Microbacterium TaxID=2609290 RepID=UPI00214A9FC5|nr:MULTISPECIES: LuxR C-terminal-related transcriptional regulator [unclassified Microbacterium]MCR2783916.1 LuxR C-terminal-related transcriptional regulator [Microbacterium sp. zg.B96]WIM15239.1 LuxR C-terminal-related transcriptional regulator [Microbacterium sp. zg-B96]
MASALALGRARSDIDVMSRAGLPLLHFADEAAAALQTAVPFVAACLSTLDPATAMVSSTAKLGALTGRNEGDILWAQIEYGGDDPTTYSAMLAAGEVALGLHEATAGEVERSPRMAQLLRPHFDFHDEARAVFTDRNGSWGAFAVFRGSDDAPFSPDEIAFIAAVAPAFTRGIRTGLLAQQGSVDEPPAAGPAVVVIDAHDRIVQSSPAAEQQLRQVSAAAGMGDPLVAVQALVSAARRLTRSESDRMPRVRVRRHDGVWLVLQAAPLGGSGDRAGDVVVTIEQARPQEVVDLVAAAFGLTVREREVVGMVLRGADTREIAGAMHLSPYTVQDHLKSVFDKAGVTSRRELVSRAYFDQFARSAAVLGPGGWQASAT